MGRIIILILLVAIGCSKPDAPAISGDTKVQDMILQDGKFISPRQVRAVTGDK